MKNKQKYTKDPCVKSDFDLLEEVNERQRLEQSELEYLPTAPRPSSETKFDSKEMKYFKQESNMVIFMFLKGLGLTTEPTKKKRKKNNENKK